MERLEHDVRSLATSAGRCVGTIGHEQAKRYLLERMKQLGLAPYHEGSYELPYQAGRTDFSNLLGRIPGSKPQLTPILLGAHYDTAGVQPGADDNAAAIAIVLAVAERLLTKQPERPVDIAFFDAEEPPYYLTSAMGSTMFYAQQRQSDYHCAIILDLVGHDVPVPGLEDLIFITGIESDPGLADVLSSCQVPETLRSVATLNRYVGDMSDHHVFRVNERPYLFLSCGRWRHYHQPSDTPEKLNYQKMQAIVSYLLDLVYEVGKTKLDGPFEGYDSTPVELELMNRAIGQFAASYGIRLETRRDIDQIASLFLGQLML